MDSTIFQNTFILFASIYMVLLICFHIEKIIQILLHWVIHVRWWVVFFLILTCFSFGSFALHYAIFSSYFASLLSYSIPLKLLCFYGFIELQCKKAFISIIKKKQLKIIKMRFINHIQMTDGRLHLLKPSFKFKNPDSFDKQENRK